MDLKQRSQTDLIEGTQLKKVNASGVGGSEWERDKEV